MCMKNILLYSIAVIILIACTPKIDANESLSKEEYDQFLESIAPYVIKKPDNISYEERFLPENLIFYKNYITKTESKLLYYHQNDSVTFFFFLGKDLSSLFEHYRGLGGYCKRNENGKMNFVNLLYHTPRFTKEEVDQKGKELFLEMISKGNVDRFFGNKKYIHTPNQDFYYNTQLNKWDYTSNSSWKFLEEAKADTLR